MGLPAQIDFSPYQGDSWEQTFRFKLGSTPVDLTGATVAAWAQGLGAPVVLDVTITDPAGGEVRLALPAEMASGTYTYDIEVTQAGTVTTWVRGTLFVAADITNHAVVG